MSPPDESMTNASHNEQMGEAEAWHFMDVSQAQEQALRPLKDLSPDEYERITNVLYLELLGERRYDVALHTAQAIVIAEKVIAENDEFFPNGSGEKEAYKRLATLIVLLHDREKDRETYTAQQANILHAHQSAQKAPRHIKRLLAQVGKGVTPEQEEDINVLGAFVAQTIERHSDIPYIQQVELGEKPLLTLGTLGSLSEEDAPFLNFELDEEGKPRDAQLLGPETDMTHERAKWDHLLRACDTLSNYCVDDTLVPTETDVSAGLKYSGFIKIISYTPEGTMAEKIAVTRKVAQDVIDSGMYDMFPSLKERALRSVENMERLERIFQDSAPERVLGSYIALDQKGTSESITIRAGEANDWGTVYTDIMSPDSQSTQEEKTAAVEHLRQICHAALRTMEDEITAEKLDNEQPN